MSTHLLQARASQCRWIVADGSPSEQRSDGARKRKRVVVPGPVACGAPVRPGSSYCTCHHPLVYVPGTRLVLRPRPEARGSIETDDRVPDLVELFR